MQMGGEKFGIEVGTYAAQGDAFEVGVGFQEALFVAKALNVGYIGESADFISQLRRYADGTWRSGLERSVVNDLNVRTKADDFGGNLVFKAEGDGNSNNHHGEPHSNACGCNRNGGTRASFPVVLPTKEPASYK